jgi:hypothetical protein
MGILNGLFGDPLRSAEQFRDSEFGLWNHEALFDISADVRASFVRA